MEQRRYTDEDIARWQRSLADRRRMFYVLVPIAACAVAVVMRQNIFAGVAFVAIFVGSYFYGYPKSQLDKCEALAKADKML
jgi:hypothetical protein